MGKTAVATTAAAAGAPRSARHLPDSRLHGLSRPGLRRIPAVYGIKRVSANVIPLIVEDGIVPDAEALLRAVLRILAAAKRKTVRADDVEAAIAHVREKRVARDA